MLIKAIVLLVLAVIIVPFLSFLWSLGFHHHYYKLHPGKCWTVKQSGTGSEDFQILTSGLTFINSGLVLPSAPPGFKQFVKSKGKSSIQVLDMNLPSPEAVKLPIKHDKSFNPDIFHPHGLSVLEDKVKGEHLVYVVNHAEDEVDRVEKFRYLPKTKELQHVKSIFSDMIFVTNDLTVIAEDKFYITNWLYFTNQIMSLIEQVYRFPTGGVLFYNGTDFTKVIEGIHDPNGVIHSKDKRYLYVSLPNIHMVHVYKRDSDYDFQLVQEVDVHTGLDNFHLSENGDSLFGGCHPIPHQAVKNFINPAEGKAPSQVIQLPLKDGLIVEGEITLEFYDHGDLVEASSVAGVYKDKMLIGTVLETTVICQLPKK